MSEIISSTCCWAHFMSNWRISLVNTWVTFGPHFFGSQNVPGVRSLEESESLACVCICKLVWDVQQAVVWTWCLNVRRRKVRQKKNKLVSKWSFPGYLAQIAKTRFTCVPHVVPSHSEERRSWFKAQEFWSCSRINWSNTTALWPAAPPMGADEADAASPALLLPLHAGNTPQVALTSQVGLSPRCWPLFLPSTQLHDKSQTSQQALQKDNQTKTPRRYTRLLPLKVYQVAQTPKHQTCDDTFRC